MNLVLSFVHPTKPAKTAGPFECIVLDGESLRERPNGAVVARHRRRQWEVDGESYFRLDATTKVRIQFEREVREPRASRMLAKSRLFGPFMQFSAVDGLAYTDNRVFASSDAKLGDWFCYDDARHWAIMIVTDATTRLKKNPLAAVLALAPQVAGVIGLWDGAELLRLARAQSIRAWLERAARVDAGRVSAVTWEPHAHAAARQVELRAEYEAGSRSLLKTYGRCHGNRVRTCKLIERARRLTQRAEYLCRQSALTLAAHQ
jgi:hypothetical protein